MGALMAAVAQQPVMVAIYAEPLMYYTGGIAKMENSRIRETFPGQLDHAVLLVGYGTDTQDGASVDYFKLKNSWDTDWGEDGYFRLARSDGLKSGTLGMYLQPAYPVISE